MKWLQAFGLHIDILGAVLFIISAIKSSDILWIIGLITISCGWAMLSFGSDDRGLRPCRTRVIEVENIDE